MFLINDEKSQIFILDVLSEKLVRADYDVRASVGNAVENVLFCFGGIKAAEAFDNQRSSGKSVPEAFVMLIGKQRCWNQNNHLSS